MIKNSQKQTKSIYVVMGTILVVTILALLGFLFWQNFINKNSLPTQDERSNISMEADAEVEAAPTVVDENDYSFTVVEGFSESTEQQFTYTGSLKAIKTFVNKDGDYFEVLTNNGGGGGVSGDYSWNYSIQNGAAMLDKKPRCTEDNSFCFANNGSVEGVISNSPDGYYFAFGNKTKNEINIDYVDTFMSTVTFK